MKTIIQDTREKPSAIKKINKALEENGYSIIRSKLYVGDYQLLENPFYVVDRKQRISEVIQNIGSDHIRFKAEIQRAIDNGIQVDFLIEHGEEITCIDDLRFWYNPYLKKYPRAMKGTTLAKSLETIEMVYGVKFYFCTKNETGNKIIELLEKALAKRSERKNE